MGLCVLVPGDKIQADWKQRGTQYTREYIFSNTNESPYYQIDYEIEIRPIEFHPGRGPWYT